MSLKEIPALMANLRQAKAEQLQAMNSTGTEMRSRSGILPTPAIQQPKETLKSKCPKKPLRPFKIWFGDIFSPFN